VQARPLFAQALQFPLPDTSARDQSRRAVSADVSLSWMWRVQTRPPALNRKRRCVSLQQGKACARAAGHRHHTHHSLHIPAHTTTVRLLSSALEISVWTAAGPRQRNTFPFCSVQAGNCRGQAQEHRHVRALCVLTSAIFVSCASEAYRRVVQTRLHDWRHLAQQLTLHAEDGGNTMLRNAGKDALAYAPSLPRTRLTDTHMQHQ
jgi:hypothetical protein